jgi:formamidopyrimidine-DNA glycosylase
VEVGGDPTKFPDHWLMRHDWNRKIKHQKLPNGEPVVFYKVGSRASAYVPIVQVKSRIEKGGDNRKIQPTTELLFEMENPPKTKFVEPPPKEDVMALRDDGSCIFEEEEAQKLLPGERPQTAGSVYSPPPTRQNPGRSKRW